MNTKRAYGGYYKHICRWYVRFRPDLCGRDGRLDPRKFDKAVAADCAEEAKWFKRFINTLKHRTFKDEDGNPLPKLVGTLSGYRSALTHYVWDSLRLGVPMQWDRHLKGY